MACAGRFANGHHCTYPAKRYGVCGRHSKQAVDYTNMPGFIEFVDEYTNLICQYHEATQELERQDWIFYPFRVHLTTICVVLKFVL